MSVELVNAVLTCKLGLGGTAKSVLLLMAHRADASGYCYMSLQQMQDSLERDEKTLRAAMKLFVIEHGEEPGPWPSGVVERFDRRRKNGSRASTGYRLLIDRLQGVTPSRSDASLPGETPTDLPGEAPTRAARETGETPSRSSLPGEAPTRNIDEPGERPSRTVPEGGAYRASRPPPTTFESTEESFSSSSSPEESGAGAQPASNSDEEDENGGDVERQTALDAMRDVVRRLLSPENAPDEELRNGVLTALRSVGTGKGDEWRYRGTGDVVPWSQRAEILEEAITHVLSRSRVTDPLHELKRYVRYHAKLLRTAAEEAKPAVPPAPPPRPNDVDPLEEVSRRLAEQLIQAHPEEVKQIEAAIDAELDADPVLCNSAGRKSARRVRLRQRVLTQLGGVTAAAS